MSNVTEIKSKQRINQDAIELLKETIRMVESGEIESVAVCWVNNENGIGGNVSDCNNTLMLWSSLSHSEREFYNNIVNSD